MNTQSNTHHLQGCGWLLVPNLPLSVRAWKTNEPESEAMTAREGLTGLEPALKPTLSDPPN